MVVGVHGLHGQSAQQHVEGESKLGCASATALSLSMAERSVWEKPMTATVVTKSNVLLVSTITLRYVFIRGSKAPGTDFTDIKLYTDID